MGKKTTAKKIVITLPVASSVTIEKLKQESEELEILTGSSNSNQWILPGFQPDERQLSHRDHERYRYLAHEFVIIV